jgi:hypothetical protein
MSEMGKYNKAIVAGIGFVVILVNTIWGEAAGEQVQMYANAVIAFLTAVGVYQVPNNPKV